MPTPVGPRVTNPSIPASTTPRTTRPATQAPAAAAVTARDGFEPAPPPPPTSLPANLPVSVQDLRGMLQTAGVEVSTRQAMTLADLPRGTLTAGAGTRLSASVGDSSLYLRADPPLRFDPKPGPAFDISSIRYDFADARFHVEAQGVGPDSAYSALATWAANRYLTPLMPAAMQRPGYSPRGDANLVQTLQGIATGRGGGGAGAGAIDADDFERPTLHASIRTGEELKMPVAGGKAEVSVPAGTSFDVTCDMTGPANHPAISQVRLSTWSQHGITVAQTQGLGAGIAGLEIREARLDRGGAVSLDYELIPEQMLQGGYALLALFGAMAGDPSLLNRPMPDMRLEGVRKDVDARIAREVGPQIVELIRRNDGAIPGFSLVEALGLQ